MTTTENRTPVGAGVAQNQPQTASAQGIRHESRMPGQGGGTAPKPGTPKDYDWLKQRGLLAPVDFDDI